MNFMDKMNISNVTMDMNNDSCQAKMKITAYHLQPYGLVHGGVWVAVAEELAGRASIAFCQTGTVPVGQSVSAQHLHPCQEGALIIILGKLMHKGQHRHVWQFAFYNEKGATVSRVTVDNAIICPKK